MKLAGFPVNNSFAPRSGARAITLEIDWTTDADQEFDLLEEVKRNEIDFVQTIYVDNIDNGNPLTLTFGVTQQRIRILGNRVGVFPVISTTECRFRAQSTAAAVISRLIFVNVPMPHWIMATA